jgi:hypothetical protein
VDPTVGAEEFIMEIIRLNEGTQLPREFGGFSNAFRKRGVGEGD